MKERKNEFWPGIKKEEIELDAKKSVFAKDDAELKDIWRKQLKYQVSSVTSATSDCLNKQTFSGSNPQAK